MPGVRCQYNEQVFYRWWWKERQNGLCTVVRGSYEEAGAVRNGGGIQAWAAPYSHICVFDSQGQCWHPWLTLQQGHREGQGCGPPRVAILVSKGCAPTGTMLIWVACAATRGHDDILSPGNKAISGSVPQQQSESGLMSTTPVTTGHHRNHVYWNLRAVAGSVPRWTLQHGRVDPSTHSGKMAATVWALDRWLCPLLVRVVPMSRASYHSDLHLGPWVWPSLTVVSSMTWWSARRDWSCIMITTRSSWLNKSRISEKSFWWGSSGNDASETGVFEPDLEHFAGGADWTKGIYTARHTTAPDATRMDKEVLEGWRNEVGFFDCLFVLLFFKLILGAYCRGKR